MYREIKNQLQRTTSDLSKVALTTQAYNPKLKTLQPQLLSHIETPAHSQSLQTSKSYSKALKMKVWDTFKVSKEK